MIAIGPQFAFPAGAGRFGAGSARFKLVSAVLATDTLEFAIPRPIMAAYKETLT